jgi:hypothetical protein
LQTRRCKVLDQQKIRQPKPSAAKSRRKRIAVKTCCAIGLAEAEGTKNAKRTKENLT